MKLTGPTAALLLAATAASGQALSVYEFERAADDWLSAAPAVEAVAFDEFYPGIQPGGGCLVPPPEDAPVVLKLAGGTVTVSAFDSGGAPACAVRDGGSNHVLSDGSILEGGMLVMEFAPPISAFYGFYGSLQEGSRGTMTLYSGPTQIDQITGASSPENAFATGHGFVSPVLVDRIEFTSNETGNVLLGAFTFLVEGEPSLGTVTIPGYGGPSGDEVNLDFGCVFVPEPDRVHNLTQDTWHYSITAAIAAADEGDEILATAGTYHELIDFAGKAVTLRGPAGAGPGEGAIIDGSGLAGSVVTCVNSEGTDTVLENLTITGGTGTPVNGSPRGGGLFCLDAGPTVSGCTFLANEASFGGGVYVAGVGSSPVFDQCAFEANTASIVGGGMYAQGSPTVSGSSFNGNLADRGGGLYNSSISGGTASVTACVFSDNHATGEGGGGMYNLYSSPVVADCVFLENGTDGLGGAMYNVDTVSAITGCEFTGNTAAVGAGMHNTVGKFGSSPIVTGCTFSGNAAVYDGSAGSGNGGGMVTTGSGSSPLVTDCTFSGNTADIRGGAIYHAAGADPTLAGCTFTGNSAGDGGAVYNTGSGTIAEITGCTFSVNTVGDSGGAISIVSAAFANVTGCRFDGNVSLDGSGGAVMIDQASPVLTNCRFLSNETPLLWGGGVRVRQGSATLTNCTFHLNTSGISVVMGSAATVSNCVFWDNVLDLDCQDDGSCDETVVDYSLVQTGWAGPGGNVISADPLFVDGAGGDVRLRSGSPAIDAADSTAVPEGIETDLGGSPRFVDDPGTPDSGVSDGVHPAVDMGAYEHCPGDLNGDGTIDVQDLVNVILAWGSDDAAADANNDGIVDVQDLTIVILAWGGC